MEFLAFCYWGFFYSMMAIGAIMSAVRLGKYNRFSND